MYQPSPTWRDRAGSFAAVVLIHLGIGYALLHLTGAGSELARHADLAIFNVFVPPPPPPPPPAVEARETPQQAKPRKEEGAAAPKNIDSKPTPVVAPVPRIIIPAVPPVVAAPLPATGTAPTQGASPVVGPGTGAGGTGNGTGSGGSSNGGGGGGGGGTGGGGGLGEARARLLTPSLTRRDFPESLYRQAPRGGSVFIIVRVAANGSPLSCRIARSFGDPVIDGETCRLAVERFRFSPGRDEEGRAVADFFGYRQDFNTRF